MSTREFIFVPSYLADIIGKQTLNLNAIKALICDISINGGNVPFSLRDTIKDSEHLYINIAFHTYIICKELGIPFNSSVVCLGEPSFSSQYYLDVYNDIESNLLTKPDNVLNEDLPAKKGQLYENIVTLSDMYIVYVNEGFLYNMSHNKEEAKKFFLECMRLLYNERNFDLLFHRLLAKINS